MREDIAKRVQQYNACNFLGTLLLFSSSALIVDRESNFVSKMHTATDCTQFLVLMELLYSDEVAYWRSQSTPCKANTSPKSALLRGDACLNYDDLLTESQDQNVEGFLAKERRSFDRIFGLSGPRPGHSNENSTSLAPSIWGGVHNYLLLLVN